MTDPPLVDVNYDLSYSSSEIIFECHLPSLNVADNAKHLSSKFDVSWFRNDQQVNSQTVNYSTDGRQVSVHIPITNLFGVSEKPVLGFSVSDTVLVHLSLNTCIREIHL